MSLQFSADELTKEIVRYKNAVREREKELCCLYGLAKIVERPGVTINEILTDTVELMPPAWRYPEIACARIVLDDDIYTSNDFEVSPTKLTEALIVGGKEVGCVQVYYKEARDEADEGPFLKEERALLNAIAERVGRIVERMRTTNELQKANAELEERVAIRTADLAKANERLKEEIRMRENARKDLLELSTPIIRVGSKILALPLIGTLDSHRAQDALEKSLMQMAEEKAHVLLVDITGVSTVDTMVANSLIMMAKAVGLMGGQCILTGISPAIARTIVHLGIDLGTLRTYATLEQGLSFAQTVVCKREA